MVTYNVEEIVHSIEVGTQRKQRGRKETYFKFVSNENQQASSKSHLEALGISRLSWGWFHQFVHVQFYTRRFP